MVDIIIIKPVAEDDFYLVYNTTSDMPTCWGTRVDLMHRVPWVTNQNLVLADELGTSDTYNLDRRGWAAPRLWIGNGLDDSVGSHFVRRDDLRALCRSWNPRTQQFTWIPRTPATTCTDHEIAPPDQTESRTTMSRRHLTVKVSDIPGIIDDPQRGVVSLVGDHGGLSLITGDTHASGLVMGTLAIETEHGTVYLGPDFEAVISEDDGRTLEQRSEGGIYAVADMLMCHLSERYSWYATSDDRAQALKELTDRVAGDLDDLLADHPAEKKER